MSENKLWKVDEIEAVNFDENGKETGTWKGYSVVKDGDETNYNFDCRNKLNADRLCDFLNNECIEIDDSIDAFVIDNCIEWSNLVSNLSKKESEYLKSKAEYDQKEFEIVYTSDINFKELYGSTSEKVRKQHAKTELKDLKNEVDRLELNVNYLKRRLSFLKQIVGTKTALLGVKGHE